MAHVEIISGRDRRREWTREQKEAILTEAFAPGVNVRAFSRRIDISTSLLYKWREALWKAKPIPAFAPVIAIPDKSASELPGRAEPVSLPQVVPVPRPGKTPVIEIEAGGKKARIPASMPPELAAAVVAAMVKA